MDVYKERISEVLSNPDLYIKSSEKATSYNSWLKDYLLQGGAPTNVYSHNGVEDFVCIESNPHLVSLPLAVMGGSLAKNFVLSRMYDVEKYRGLFCSVHNALYGWDRDGKAIYYGSSVPLYEDTIDRHMALDHGVPLKVRNMILEVRKKEALRVVVREATGKSICAPAEIAEYLINQVKAQKKMK